MKTIADRAPVVFAGLPAGSWGFAVRVWLSLTLALYASFALELQSPSSAALTVAILAIATRGQGLERAGYRLMATAVGVAASITITGLFAQTGALLIVAFAVWIGLCIYKAGLVDGNRAYAATLGITTVAFVAIEQIDSPQNVFRAGVERGAGIAIGIVAVALVNDFLGAANYYPKVVAQLESLRTRVNEYASSTLDSTIKTTEIAATLLHDIVTLRSDISSLAWESSNGAARTAAARATMVELVFQLAVARVLHGYTVTDKAVLDYAKSRLLHGRADVLTCIDAIRSGTNPPHKWRTPFYRSHRIGIENGLRAATCFLMAAAVFVLTGWPQSAISLALVAVLIGLSATVPSARTFAIAAAVSSPTSFVLTGVLEFVLLDGVDAFPLLAICLAPVIIGLALAISLPNPIVSVLGRLNLIFVVAILGPSNPQNYDPQTFLLSGLFSCLATTLVLATQTLVPPLSTHRKLALLFDACRREFDTGTYWRDRRWSPEEATFFDATLIEQIVSAGGTSNSNRRELAAAMHDIGPTACRRPAAHCRSPHAVIRRINPAPCHVSVPSHQDLTSDRASIRKWKPEGKFK